MVSLYLNYGNVAAMVELLSIHDLSRSRVSANLQGESKLLKVCNSLK